ncbi:MAG: hypothetical protein E3J47_08125 [Candidatus Stahlbacteria bacterium]|nr:MAG: hypothetical protein E3J47_08125 [Candidatus Stahlbacteria bacterium]
MKSIIKSCLLSVIASCKRYEVDFDTLLAECIGHSIKNCGLCIKCEKDNPIKDPLCPECRKKYDEESRDWKSIIQDILC